MSAVGPVPTFRALAIGFYGAPNVGDEVLLDILVHRVHELGGELVVASIDPVMTRRMHAVESIQFANIGDVGRAPLLCEVLIMGGGASSRTIILSTLMRSICPTSMTSAGTRVRCCWRSSSACQSSCGAMG